MTAALAAPCCFLGWARTGWNADSPRSAGEEITGLGWGTAQCLSRCVVARSVRAGQGCVERLALSSSSSLFLHVACLEAKTLSKGGSTWAVSAAETSLANEGVC